MNGIIRFFVLTAYFLVAIMGLMQLIKGNIRTTSYLTGFMYADMILKEIIKLLHTLEKYQEGHIPLIRFFEILDIKPNVVGISNSKKIEKIEGKIEFKNAYFKYEENEDLIIKNLNFKINKGEHVSLIGPSGAGKTTICNLLQRFWDLNKGEILIDGHNIKEIPLKQLHKTIGVVEQNIFLFPGTILENILYGNTNATKEEIIDAAKNANLFNFICSLPNGFETNIGERGIKLSGGQKQRIGIARTFLKNPTILILDEATSSLDITTEKIINESLNKLTKNKTTITIAHKPSTIKNSEKILVLEDGTIKNQGTHEELLKNNEFYRKIYE